MKDTAAAHDPARDPDPVLRRMARHASVRDFRDAPIPEEHVERAIRAASMAATSSHVIGYALLEVRAAEKREKLAELAGGQPQVARAGRFFVVCAEQRRHRLAARRAGRPFVPNFESFLVDVIDAALFAQNLALAFEALDYGTCYIGGLRTHLPVVDEVLDLPKDVFALFGLAVGLPETVPATKPRLGVDALRCVDRFPSEVELERQLDEFDATMADYYRSRGLEGRNWTGGLAAKFASPKREHLYEYYRRKGAVLHTLDASESP
ncbi:MAG: nitroreductase family protein [Planctomycetota bacterium]